MNWTGGRLQQSRRAGTTITAQQRNYFARARAELLNGRKAPSPPRLDLAHAQADYEASRRRGTHHSRARRGETLRWGSDDSPDVASITNPRSSITTYKTTQESSQSGRIRKRKAHEKLDLYTAGMTCAIAIWVNGSDPCLYYRRASCEAPRTTQQERLVHHTHSQTAGDYFPFKKRSADDRAPAETDRQGKGTT